MKNDSCGLIEEKGIDTRLFFEAQHSRGKYIEYYISLWT